jgi:hypothetical protein
VFVEGMLVGVFGAAEEAGGDAMTGFLAGRPAAGRDLKELVVCDWPFRAVHTAPLSNLLGQ